MLTNFDELSFGIMSVLRVRHEGGKFSVAARPYAAISFRISGSGIIDVAGERLESYPGDVLYIPQGVPYLAEYTETEMIVAHLVGCNYPTPEVYSSASRTQAEALFQKMLDGWEGRRSANYVKSKIYALLDELAGGGADDGSDPALLNSVKYMEEHIDDPSLSIESVCRAAYLCRSTIQRKFIRRFGISPQQYLIRMRLERAITLLAQEKLPVGEVAVMSGFSDEKYFSRAFKKRYGFSPSQAVKNMLI